MIKYEEQTQEFNGTTRTLIITKSVIKEENSDNYVPYKQLIQQPSGDVYGAECIDVGHLENGLPIYLNNISYIEGEEIVESDNENKEGE